MSLLIFSLFLVFPHAAHAGDLNKSRPKPPGLANSVVRSDKWIIRREKGEEEFQGNVSYHQGTYRFKSDWAIYRKKDEHWEARGNLYGSKTWDNGTKTECYADRGEYFQDTGQGAVFSDGRERVKVIHYEPDSGTWRSYSDRVTLNEPESLMTFLGNVLIKGHTMQAMGDNAVYDNLASMITLSGGYPVAYGTTVGGDDYAFAIQGDLIKIYRKPERMTACGKVRGWIRNEQVVSSKG